METALPDGEEIVDEVEAIISHRWYDDALEYLVHWRGAASEDDEWFSSAEVQEFYPSEVAAYQEKPGVDISTDPASRAVRQVIAPAVGSMFAALDSENSGDVGADDLRAYLDAHAAHDSVFGVPTAAWFAALDAIAAGGSARLDIRSFAAAIDTSGALAAGDGPRSAAVAAVHDGSGTTSDVPASVERDSDEARAWAMIAALKQQLSAAAAHLEDDATAMSTADSALGVPPLPAAADRKSVV